MALSVVVPFLIAGLLVGSIGGIVVYRQLEYGVAPPWQTEIISRFGMTHTPSVTVSDYQFEYQGNAEWTDLYGSGGISDVGMWSLLIDANGSAIKLGHTRLMTLFIAGQRDSHSTYYWVLGSIILPSSGCTFAYSGTPISTDASTWIQLEISTSDYSLLTHVSR